ncbi:putative ankyrin repeat-containing domain-containing protein [Helianthus annuus]|nr:putative ankyrin repeat-containing domain-containing protein [Helianthus annuus]
MSQLSVETEDTSATLLELAANDDIEGFKKAIESDPSGIDEVGLWYGRQKGSKQMVLEHRTPLMVAAMYGSIDVLKLILSQSKADVNRLCGVDTTTALHCAASGGSVNAVEVVKLLLLAGADLNLIDVNGLRPVDVIVVSPKFPGMKKTLEELLGVGVGAGEITVLPLSETETETELEPGPELDMSKREYPIDPSLPDIKNSIYSTDEFRMYSFKVRPCSRAYSHDWTEGGDMCEYAHGVFECWLHPAQYRTRLCKDGPGCNRRVCFFAHTRDELRPLFVSTGSVVGSPRSSGGPSALDFAAAMSLMPGLGPGPGPSFTPPLSPNANGNWAPPNVPSLHLPGSNLQSSRLRSSLNARDMEQDLNIQLLNELNRQQRTVLTPTKLDDIFAAESLSPRFNDQSVFSPRHSSSVFNQFQQQEGMLSPINTNFSPKNTPFSVQSVQSPGRMSPRSVDPISPMSSRVSILARENQHQFRSLSSRELGSRSSGVTVSGSGSGVDPWLQWGSGNEKPDWAVENANADEFGKLRRSSSFENVGSNAEEPDLSWVQSLVKETPPEKAVADGGPSNGGGDGVNSNTQMDQSALSAWIEQMQLEHVVTQQN